MKRFPKLALIIFALAVILLLPFAFQPFLAARVCVATAKGGEQSLVGLIDGAIPIYRYAQPGECIRWARAPDPAQ